MHSRSAAFVMARHEESDKEEEIRQRVHNGYRIFIGNLGAHIGKYELSKEFHNYGPINDIWVARSPAGFAFMVFKYAEDADRAIAHLNSRPLYGRRVRAELARPYQKRGERKGQNGRGGGNRNSRNTSRSYENSQPRTSRHDRQRSRSRDRRHYRSRSRSSSMDCYRHGYSRSRTRSRTRSLSGSSLRHDGGAPSAAMCSNCAKLIKSPRPRSPRKPHETAQVSSRASRSPPASPEHLDRQEDTHDRVFY